MSFSEISNGVTDMDKAPTFLEALGQIEKELFSARNNYEIQHAGEKRDSEFDAELKNFNNLISIVKTLSTAGNYYNVEVAPDNSMLLRTERPSSDQSLPHILSERQELQLVAEIGLLKLENIDKPQLSRQIESFANALREKHLIEPIPVTSVRNFGSHRHNKSVG